MIRTATTVYERKDHFYRKAKREGKASRAVYKLLEIQKRFRVWKTGGRILDLGSAPGGWLQVLAKEVGPKGHVFGVDRLPLQIQTPENVTFLQADIAASDFRLEMDPVDAVLSDLSPNLTGVVFKDTYASYELTSLVWNLAQIHLKIGGNLVIKVFPGEDLPKLQKELKQSFERFKIVTPEATRKTSNEVYLVCLSLK